MEPVQCATCHHLFDDVTTLSLHKEYEVCSTTSGSRQPFDFSCPLCDETFEDPAIVELHVNAVHDNDSGKEASNSLHTQDVERRRSMKIQYEHHKQATSTMSDEHILDDDDAILARLLQEEENFQSFEAFQVDAETIFVMAIVNRAH
jgi:hypothetical protein